MGKVLKKEVDLNPRKQVIIRNTLPTHAPYTEDDAALLTRRKCWNETKKDHFTNYYLEQMARKLGFKYLYSAPIYKDRGDMHLPARKEDKNDCTHWCYSPELFVPEMALINKLLR